MKKMLHMYVVILLIVCLSSCATLTTSQVKTINELALVSDSVSIAPSFVFKNLKDVREERGLFYASSLTSSEARFMELSSLANYSINDDALVHCMDIYVNVLNSYLRSH